MLIEKNYRKAYLCWWSRPAYDAGEFVHGHEYLVMEQRLSDQIYQGALVLCYKLDRHRKNERCDELI